MFIMSSVGASLGEKYVTDAEIPDIQSREHFSPYRASPQSRTWNVQFTFLLMIALEWSTGLHFFSSVNCATLVVQLTLIHICR